jgi:hypothetical protein
MKKAFVCGFTGLFLAWTITCIAYGQDSTSIAKLKLQPGKINSPSTNETKPDSAILTKINKDEISTKAIRNFNKEYKNVPGAKWFKSANGLFVAYFTSENIQSWVYYNKKGIYEFMIRYYNEEKLPPEVRTLIKTSYYDFSIYLVTEASRNGKIAYVVKIEDKTCWKTIKVVDGEMEVMKEYIKAEQ